MVFSLHFLFKIPRDIVLIDATKFKFYGLFNHEYIFCVNIKNGYYIMWNLLDN